MSQIGTRQSSPHDRAKLARPIRTRPRPTRGCARASAGVHGQPKVCMGRFAKPAVALPSHSPAKTHRTRPSHQELLDNVVVTMTGGMYHTHGPAQATHPWPQRRPENCIFTVADQSADATRPDKSSSFFGCSRHFWAMQFSARLMSEHFNFRHKKERMI